MNFALMSQLQVKQKKEYAKLLYTLKGLTQVAAAQQAGVSRNTMNKWVNDEGWDSLRASLSITKEQELRRVYAQINELNNGIANREEGKRYANSKEADTLSKLAATAKSLESDFSVSDIISVFMGFQDFLQKVDPAKAKEFISLQDSFIRSKLK